MNHARIEDMIKGWFVGGFSPSAHQTQACEVAVKQYKAGEIEPSHFHKISTEITLILSGRVRMAGQVWTTGDIITLAPGEITDFEAITDTINVVVKVPGALNDKFSCNSLASK